MKILVCGVFNVENSTNIFMAKALRALGQEVVEFDYRETTKQIGVGPMNAGIVYEVSKQKPDLVIICKGDQLGVSTVQQLSKMTQTFYFYMDPIQTTAPHFLQLASECHYVSCTGAGVAQYFADNGSTKVYHIFEGVDPSYYYPVLPKDEFKTDVSFIGSRTTERMEYIYHLGSKYLVRVYGYGFGSQVFGSAFNVICSSSKAILSINTQNDIAEYFSDRVFLCLGANAFVLQKYTPGLEKYFENGKHLVWFNTKEELLSLADEYLAPEKDDVRKAIADVGYRYVIDNFTWEDSMTKLLGIVK